MPSGVLAFDIATVTGWAFGKPPSSPLNHLSLAADPIAKPMSGWQNFALRGNDNGAILATADEWFAECILDLSPAGIIFEAPILDRQTTSIATARRLMSLAGLIEKNAHLAGIRWVREAAASTIKKFTTGHGRAEKKDMVHAVNSWGWRVYQEDEADALALWAYSSDVIYRESRGERFKK